jgi:hypothetical protein
MRRTLVLTMSIRSLPSPAHLVRILHMVCFIPPNPSAHPVPAARGTPSSPSDTVHQQMSLFHRTHLPTAMCFRGAQDQSP